tara:strand:+ start:7514 stop:8407 length:894 start_codon:yes stop_codon:yes gene_type:complete
MQVKHLHIEASSFCNAKCPGCPRNAYGYSIKGLYKEQNLDFDKFIDLLKEYQKLEVINFCGNHGDPMMHPLISKMVEESGVFCSVATNGSIGRIKTYEHLAKLNCIVTFGIDGLEDTNHLYRQGVKWNNLMERIESFISAGGHAEWQFIPFAHNIHQIDQAKQLSVDLGFKDFLICETNRNYFPVIDDDKNISHWILPADGSRQPNKNFDVENFLASRINPVNLQPPRYKVKSINCEHLYGSIYVNSEGEKFPCCYQGFGHNGREKVKLEDFHLAKATWESDNCNKVCAESCGILDN